MMKNEPKLDFDRVFPVFAVVFVDVLGLTIILPLLHLYAETYGATPFQIGVVVAAFPMAQLIGVPILGVLSDRFGRRPVLLVSQISTCLGFILLGAANSLTLVILARVIDGLFGANISTAQAALADVTSDKDRARGLGLTGAAFGLGFIFGPVISIAVLEFSNSLAMPAYIAAGYSFISILLTLFMFQETLPPEKRAARRAQRNGLYSLVSVLKNPQVNLLLGLMFAQQIVFFAFESLLGLFVLTRLGLLGEGSSFVFIVVGITLVTVQARYMGRLSQKYGERRLVFIALGLLAVGLMLLAFTPEQPQPFYIRQVAENTLRSQAVSTANATSGAEAVIGSISAPLPSDGHNGIWGILWLLVVILPVSVGAGLIRPSLNSLMTRRVEPSDYGSVLGFSASFVSLANAIAPLLGGWIFQQYGAGAPFLWGGLIMGVLAVLSVWLLRSAAPSLTRGESLSSPSP